MPATAADIKFFASATMTDTADGGGPRASTIVQNGVLSNVFPSVSAADRSTGRVALRKLYPSMVNTDTAPLLGGSLALNEVPTDAAVSVWMFKFGGALTTRGQLTLPEATTSDLVNWTVTGNAGAAFPTVSAGASWTGGGTAIALASGSLGDGSSVLWSEVPAGTTLEVIAGGVTHYVQVTATRSSGSNYNAPSSPPIPEPADVPGFTTSVLPGAGAQSGTVRIKSDFRNGPRLYGALACAGSLSSGAISLTLSTRKVRTAPGGLAAALPGYRPGWVQAVDVGDIVTLWHEDATGTSTAANGTPISTGRTNLDQLAIVGANGLEIVRFLAGGPTSAIATVNLSTGVVTPTNVTGWSQPVTVRHRIAHRSAVTGLAGEVVTLGTALTRDFPAGSVLSTHLPLGDMQARALNVFAQQAWTRVWSDTLIGSPAPLMYTGLPAFTNAGAETDRYAVVFTTATAFKVYSERLGLLGTGTKAANFSPLNPATGAALFTLASSAWAADILVGSTLRFNTEAASVPVWMGRTVAPSSPTGTTTTSLRLHGSVD